MPQGIGSQVVDTPLKAQISRHYQKLGGDEARGAASATAREFKLGGRGAAARVKRYDKQIEAGNASRANRRSSGRPSDFNEDLEEEIDGEFETDKTATYREVADRLNLPQTTLHSHATKKMDYNNELLPH